MAGKLKAFASFWYDFLIGDDWWVAVGVVLALAVTAAASRTSVSCWWIVPAAVVLLLPVTVWRATRSRRTRDVSAPS
jgi:hypothetical protein